MSEAICEGFSPTAIPCGDEDFTLQTTTRLTNDSIFDANIEYTISIDGTGVNANTLFVASKSDKRDVLQTPLGAPLTNPLLPCPGDVEITVRIVSISPIGGL